MSSRRMLTGFCVWMAALFGAYFLFHHNLYVWAAIGSSSVAAVVTGVVVYRPRRPLPWLLLALALLLLTAGDTTYLVLTQVLGESRPFPSLSDVFYLATYPFLIGGLLLLPRSTTARDRGAIADALILTTALGLLAWIFVAAPDLRNQTEPVSTHVASIAYPIFDVLFLAAAARLLTEVRRTISVMLLGAGGLALLTTMCCSPRAGWSNSGAGWAARSTRAGSSSTPCGGRPPCTPRCTS